MPAADFFDYETAMRYCADDESMWKDILQIYVEEGEEHLRNIPNFVKAKDWKSYQVEVHAIKSISLNVGATDLSAKAKAQEQLAKDGRYQEINGGYENFLIEYKKVLEAAEELVFTAAV